VLFSHVLWDAVIVFFVWDSNSTGMYVLSTTVYGAATVRNVKMMLKTNKNIMTII
jgi:hypothetical protein